MDALIRFCLKGLDKTNNGREFSFVLSTTTEDLYIVENCEPPLPNERLASLVDELNDSDNLGLFFLGMRRLWIDTLS